VSVKAFGRKPTKIDPDKLAKVERQDLARSVVATGKIEPVRQVEIKSKASGIIQYLPVNFGDDVSKGQIICELDKNDLLPKLNEQKAALAVDEAQIESAAPIWRSSRSTPPGPTCLFFFVIVIAPAACSMTS